MTTIGRPVQSASQPYAPAELRQLRLRDRKQNKLVLDPIEDRLWFYYDHVEGIGTYVSVLANAADLVTYYPALENREPEGEPDPDVDSAVVEVWDSLGGEAWLSTWMAELVRHMLVPGQGWIVPVRPDSTEMVGDDEDLSEVEWRIWSTLEVREALGLSQTEQIPVNDERIWRVWMPHPQNGKRADSAVRRVADKCEALVLIDRRRIADLRSRLHAGVWPLPASLKDEKTPSGKTYADLVEESMIDPIHNPDSTSSLFPLMLWVEEADEKLMRGGPIQLAIDDPSRLDAMEEKLLQRVGIGIDAPAGMMLGTEDLNHWCRTFETEALTVDGWKPGDQISIGDQILTLDHDTGRAEWQPVTDKYLAPVADEPMVEVTLTSDRGGARRHIQMTPEHRNPVVRDGQRMIVHAHELQPGDVVTAGAPVGGLPAEPTFDDGFVQLLAWYAADGTLTGTDEKPRQIRIGKSWKKNPEAVARLTSVLTACFGPAKERMPHGADPSWRMERQPRGMMLAVLNESARNMILSVMPTKAKVIPRWFVEKLTAGQLELFIDAWLASDGTRRAVTDENAGEVTQRIPARLDALEYAAVLSGRPIRRWSHFQTGGFKDGTMHHLGIGTHRTVVVVGTKPVTYSGAVWCPVTPNGTWLAREPDAWCEYTGNTAWLTDKQMYNQHLDPLLVRILRSLTPWWRALLDARGVPSDDQMLWRNAASAVPRPNTYERDEALWDRGIVSDEVLLNSADHTVEDRPDDEELEKRIRTVQGLQGRTSQETIDVDPEGTPASPNPAEEDSDPNPEPVQAQTGEDAELAALALALARIDETLIVRMQSEAARQQTRAYRRALDRLASAAERAGIEVGDKDTLPARIGQARAVALVSNLVPEDEFDGGRLEPIIRDAQDQTASQTGRFGAARNRDADEDDRDSAVALILAALAAATFRGLFTRETPEGEAGIDGAELLPFAEIRNALDIAGGGVASRDGVRDAWSLIGNGRRSVLDLLDVGIETVGFTWDYGAAPRQNFPPHQALDGVSFDRWDDPRLQTYAPWTWIGAHFFVSDHAGCRCLARRELASNALQVAV